MPGSVARLRARAAVALMLSLAALLVGCGNARTTGPQPIDTGVWKPCWSRDGKVLYYAKPGGKRYTSEVWRYDLRTKTKTKYPYVVSDELGEFDVSPDGKWIVFTGLLDKQPGWYLAKLCLATGEVSRIYRTSHDLGGAHWLPQNRVICGVAPDESGAGGGTLIVGPDGKSALKPEQIPGARYGSDGQGFLHLDEDCSHYYVSLVDGKRIRLGIIRSSGTLFLSRRQMVYYDFSSRVMALDIRTRRKTRIHLPKADPWTEISPDLRTYWVVPKTRGDNPPPSGLYVLDIPASEREKLLRIERGEAARSPRGMAGKQ